MPAGSRSVLASAGLLILAWTGLAALAASPSLPGPLPVLHALATEMASGRLPHHLAVTLARVAASLCLALSIGSALGIAMGRSARTDALLRPWLLVALNLPALVVIALAYIWLGLTEAASIAAVAANKIPNVMVVMREGARAVDEGLLAMARAYRFSRLDLLRHVLLPQLHPFLLAAARSGLALVWKIVLLVELLGRSDGVGFQINLAFQMFDVATLLAYALAFILVAQAVELLILAPLERRATRWRTRPC